MTAVTERFDLQFVDQIPEQLEPGVLYVSMRYALVIHLCACGCGQQAITPLHPTDHKLTFDGETITLRPSIGNWRFSCRSHYFITNSQVYWARDMSDEAIAAGRLRDRQAKARAWATAVETEPEAAAPQLTHRSLRDLRLALYRFCRKQFHRGSLGDR